MSTLDRYEQIWLVVSAIPVGKVATYGQVAQLAGMPGRARLVGRALRNLPERSPVPWHRVVSATGRVAARGAPESELEQRLMLEEEGVVFSSGNNIDLARCRWSEREA